MPQESFVPDDCGSIPYPMANLTEYVFGALGERCVGAYFVMPTVIVYGFILLFGVFGNLCTCMVIVRNSSMHNATNCYLLSLAISDIVMLLLGLPMELYGVFVPLYPYRFSEITCKLRAFLIEFTSYASVLTISAFSIERWIAICFPLNAQKFSTIKRAIRVIIGIWVFAFIAASPVFVIVVINRLPLPVPYTDEFLKQGITEDNVTVIYTEFCAMDNNDMSAQKKVIYSAFIVFFLLPALLISLVYAHIVVKLKSSDKVLGSSSSGTQARSRKSVLKILVAVVIMFFICWFPFHLQRLMTIYLTERSPDSFTGDDEIMFFISTLTFYISGYCYYSNSACNPIMYNILSERYRIAFCRTVFGERVAQKLLRNRYQSVKLQSVVPKESRGSSMRVTLRAPESEPECVIRRQTEQSSLSIAAATGPEVAIAAATALPLVACQVREPCKLVRLLSVESC